MEQTNLQGSIDLLKLEKAGFATIKGVRCLVIPAQENDLFISTDIATGMPKACYLSLSIYASRKTSDYGNTHYAKQRFSKEFREGRPDEIEQRKKVYLGNFKPIVFEETNQIGTVSMPSISSDEIQNDGLPF